MFGEFLYNYFLFYFDWDKKRNGMDPQRITKHCFDIFSHQRRVKVKMSSAWLLAVHIHITRCHYILYTGLDTLGSW